MAEKKVLVAPTTLTTLSLEVQLANNDPLFAEFDLEIDTKIVGIGFYTSSITNVTREVYFDFQPLTVSEPNSSNILSNFAYLVDNSTSTKRIYLEQPERYLPQGARILWYVYNQSGSTITTTATLLVSPFSSCQC